MIGHGWSKLAEVDWRAVSLAMVYVLVQACFAAHFLRGLAKGAAMPGTDA